MIKMGSQAVVHRGSGDFRLKGNRCGNKSCTYTVRSTVILRELFCGFCSNNKKFSTIQYSTSAIDKNFIHGIVKFVIPQNFRLSDR